MHKSKWFASMVLVGTLSMSGVSAAMDFSLAFVNPWDGGAAPYPQLLMRGEINPGDYLRFIDFLIAKRLNLADQPITISSPGGDVAEALKIGELVKRFYVPVTVTPRFGQCASACFIIFASSIDRSSQAGMIGIHRPYLSRARFQSLSPAAAEAMEDRALSDAEKYLHDLRVPRNLIDTMFESASTEIHWLSEEELDQQLGSRAPWYEEFLIARCGFDKEAEHQFLFVDPDNAALRTNVLKAINCGQALTVPNAERQFNEWVRPYRARLAKGLVSQ